MSVTERDAVLAVVGRVLTASVLGESVHTALRKCDEVTNLDAWHAIGRMPDDQWHAAMALAAEWLVEAIALEAGGAAS